MMQKVNTGNVQSLQGTNEIRINCENTAPEVSNIIDELQLDVHTHNKLIRAILTRICEVMDESYDQGYSNAINGV